MGHKWDFMQEFDALQPKKNRSVQAKSYLRGVFIKVSNALMHTMTNGQFPGNCTTLDSHHPVYVQSESATALVSHPCTSVKQCRRYIRKGCVLDGTGFKINKNSFILDQYIVRLNRKWGAAHQHQFIGKVPGACIVAPKKK